MNNLVHQPLPLAPPNITAQSLPPPFITTDLSINTIDIQKRHLNASPSVTHFQDNPTFVLLKIFFLQIPPIIFSEPKHHKNPSPRTRRHLLVTHYDCEEIEQKTLHKYAINQVTQCESEPEEIKKNYRSYTYFKSPSYNPNRIQFHSKILKEKVHFSQVSNEN